MKTEDSNVGPLTVIGSLLFFTLTNQLLRLVIPRSAKTNAVQAWKWKNVANSLLHSVITGPWSLWCFYQYPEMAEDLISIYNVSSHMLVSLSAGYFIHDFLDMAINHRKKSSFELMIHHVCVVCCFGLSVISQRYVGYAVLSILVEVNSIFLHTRQLLNIVGSAKDCPRYRFNSLLNIITFLFFRIIVLGWMTRWLVVNREAIPLPIYTLGSVALAIIMVMNIVLFFRICTVDFCTKHQETNKTVDQLHTKKQQQQQQWTESEEKMMLTMHSVHLPNGTNLHVD